MDLVLLKKKISSYRTPTGRITNIPDEVAYEILLSWEEWSGPASGFYKALGADHRKMASLIGRAKKLKRDGVFIDSQFKEIKVEALAGGGGEEDGDAVNKGSLTGGISLIRGKNQILFQTVEQLVEFLNKIDKSSLSPMSLSEAA